MMELQRPKDRVDTDAAQLDILLSAIGSCLKAAQANARDTEKQLTDRIQELERKQESLEENMGVIQALLEKTMGDSECKDQLAERNTLYLDTEDKLMKAEEENARLKESQQESERIIKQLETERDTAQTQLAEEREQQKCLGEYYKKYLEINLILNAPDKCAWLEDAAVKGIFSQNYAVFFGNCGNKDKVLKFYRNIVLRLKAENIPGREEYCALLDLILDFCVTACAEIYQIKLRRQKVEPGESFNFRQQQSLDSSGGGQARLVREIVLQGIETMEGDVFNDIKALVRV